MRTIILILSVSLLSSSCSSAFQPTGLLTYFGAANESSKAKQREPVSMTILEPQADTTLLIGQTVITKIQVIGTSVQKATAFIMPPLETPQTVDGTSIDGTSIQIEVTVPDVPGSTTLKAIAIDDNGDRLEASIPVIITPNIR